MEQAGTRRTTRQIEIGTLKIGGDAPVVVQSMCATRTVDIDQTVAQTHQLARAGAGIVRILKPEKSSTVLIGLSDEVTSRNPVWNALSKT